MSTRIKMLLYCIAVLSCNSHDFSLKARVAEMNKEQVKSMWEEILVKDQSARGVNSIDSVDNNNFVLTMYLIEQHGYPDNFVPNLVFTHQSCKPCRTKYIPIFYKYFNEGKIDTFWFLHNLRGVFRGEYGRDLIRDSIPKARQISEYSKLIDLEEEVYFNDEEYYFMLNKYRNYVDEIHEGDKVGEWLNISEDVHRIWQRNGQYYYEKVYRDNSSNGPIQINKLNSNLFEFTQDIGYRDKLEIDSNNNLVVLLENMEPELVKTAR